MRVRHMTGSETPAQVAGSTKILAKSDQSLGAVGL